MKIYNIIKKEKLYFSLTALTILIFLVLFSLILLDPFIEETLGININKANLYVYVSFNYVLISFIPLIASVILIYFFIKKISISHYEFNNTGSFIILIYLILPTPFLISLAFFAIFMFNNIEFIEMWSIILIMLCLFFTFYSYIIVLFGILTSKIKNRIFYFSTLFFVPIILFFISQMEISTSININDSSEQECSGFGDESFIRSKMSQMNRDILEFNTVGKRKYYVRYVSWSSGSANYGDEVLDYINAPCHD